MWCIIGTRYAKPSNPRWHILGQTLATAWRASLEVASAQCDSEVGDERVLRLARAVRHKHAPVVLLAQLERVNGLRDRANLVHLQGEALGGRY